MGSHCPQIAHDQERLRLLRQNPRHPQPHLDSASCNSEKGTKGVYQFFRDKYPEDTQFFDHIPPLLEKKYLKTIYSCHICNTIDQADFNQNNEIDIFDLDIALAIR